jgi:putative Mg2+ transporter-C (MgtC) family protein
MILELIAEFFATSATTQLTIAAGLGVLMGLEREFSGKDPSLRTFTLICLGSCAFSIISVDSVIGVVNADPSRIAAQIVTGVGFLGAGTIFRSANRVVGLTTAALMWVTASIGMAVGFGRTDVAVTATLLSLFATIGLRAVRRVTIGMRRHRRESHEIAPDAGGPEDTTIKN